MYLKCYIRRIPFRTLTFLFMVWSYTTYAHGGKNVGFYCDDESIKHPYNGDSVHISHVVIIVHAIYVSVIYVSKFLFGRVKNNLPHAKPRFRLLLNYYYSGSLYLAASCEVLKFTFPVLRPHFFSTCVPDMSNILCSDGLITQFNCTGEMPTWLIRSDIYKSFPSTHAALAVYAFVYLNIYLYENRKNIYYTCLYLWWRRMVTSLSLLWTIFCCISRVLDRRHFWQDVFGGAFLGVIFGVIMINLSLRTTQIKSSKSINVSAPTEKEN